MTKVCPSIAIRWILDTYTTASPGFQRLENQLRSKDHIGLLRPLLPERYFPLQANGNGIQSVCLTELSAELFDPIAMLIGAEANHIRDFTTNQPGRDRQVVSADVEIWSTASRMRSRVILRCPTERGAVIMARADEGYSARNLS